MNKRIGTIVAAGGIALALAGCGTAAMTTAQSSNPAVAAATGANNPFATSAAPAPNGTAPQGAPGGMRGQRGGGVMGTITAVNGSTLTVQDRRANSAVTVAVSSTTQILKDSPIALADVQAGQTLIASGTQSGTSFTAAQVRVGSADSMTQAGGPGGRGGQPGGAPPAGGQNGQGGPGGQPGNTNGTTNGNTNGGRGSVMGRGERLVGTVEQVANNAITVKLADGSTVQVTLAANGQITQQVAGSSADLVANANVLVMGQRSDTTVTAARITIVPALMQPGQPQA